MNEINEAQNALQRIHKSLCSRKLKCECPLAVKEEDLKRVIRGFEVTLEENQKLRAALLQERTDAQPTIEESPRVVSAVSKAL